MEAVEIVVIVGSPEPDLLAEELLTGDSGCFAVATKSSAERRSSMELVSIAFSDESDDELVVEVEFDENVEDVAARFPHPNSSVRSPQLSTPLHRWNIGMHRG